MKKIGLTGGIGSGKSFIAGILQKMGYPVFFSDEFAKSIYDVDQVVKSSLISYFGAELYSSGNLDRTMLATIIFEKEENRQKVNELVHPRVRKAFLDFVAQQKSKIVFNEAAILFETGGHAMMDATILVTAPVELRLKRAMQRDGSSEAEVLARINRQWIDELKIPMADYLIINDDQHPLLQQIEQIINKLT